MKQDTDVPGRTSRDIESHMSLPRAQIAGKPFLRAASDILIGRRCVLLDGPAASADVIRLQLHQLRVVVVAASFGAATERREVSLL